jgi:hypothetical protein
MAPVEDVEVLRPIAVAIDTLGPVELQAGDPLLVECVVLDRAGERFAMPGEAPTVRYTPESSVARAPDGGLVVVRAGALEARCFSDALSLADEEPLVVAVRAAEPVATEATLDDVELEAGGSVRASCVAVDAWDNASAVPLVPEAHPDERVSSEGEVLRFERAGQYAVSCPRPGASARADLLTVVPSAPASFELGVSPRRAVYPVGEVVELVPEVRDRFDNVVASTTLELALPAGVTRFGERRVALDAEGRHRIRASVGGLGREVTLVANGEAPRVRCTDPPDASALTAEPEERITIRGMVSDALGVASLEVEGRPVTLGAGGAWSATLEAGSGMRFVEIRARDRGGLESSSVCTYLVAPRYVEPSVRLLDAGAIGLSPAAIDDPRAGFTSFGDGLRSVLNHEGNWRRLDAALRSINPIKPRSCDEPGPFGTCLASSENTYVSSRISGPIDAELTPLERGVRARVSVPRVAVTLAVDARALGVPVRSTGEVTVEDIALSLVLDIAMLGGRPRVSLRFDSEELRLGRIRSSFPGLSGALLNAVVRFSENRIRRVVVASLLAELRERAASTIGAMLSEVGAPQVEQRASVPRLDGGTSLLVTDVRPSRLVLDGRALRVSVDATIRAGSRRAGLPPIGVPTRRATTAPALPLPARRAAIATVDTELLARAAHALWEAGTFETAVSGVRVGGSSEAGASVSMLLPPYVEVRDGRARVEVGAARAEVRWPGVLAEPVEISFGAVASASLALRGDAFSLADPRVERIVVGSPTLALAPSVRASIESFLSGVARYFLVEVFARSLPRLPLPRFPIPAELRGFGLPAGDLGLVSPTFSLRPEAAVLEADLGLLSR